MNDAIAIYFFCGVGFVGFIAPFTKLSSNWEIGPFTVSPYVVAVVVILISVLLWPIALGLLIKSGGSLSLDFSTRDKDGGDK